MPELTRPDRVLIKVLQTAEIAEKVARCLKHQGARGPFKEAAKWRQRGGEREMHPVSWSRTKPQCYGH